MRYFSPNRSLFRPLAGQGMGRAKSSKARLVLADDHDLVREGLRRILEASGELEVVGEASNGTQALELCERLAPDVMVTDVSMPEIDGIDATAALRVRGSEVRVLVVSMFNDEVHAIRALRAGASGFVGKDEPSASLLEAVREVARGRRYLPRLIRGKVLEALRRVRPLEPASLSDLLSYRELQVLRYLAEGHNHREIARRLRLSPKTIDSHRTRLLKKLALRNNSDLTRFAIRNGLARP